MHPPSPSPAAPAAASKRPSLMVSGAGASASPAGPDSEVSGFGVSILGAVQQPARGLRTGPRPLPPPQARRRGQWAWWVGIAVIATGLVGAAEWRRLHKAPAPVAAPSQPAAHADRPSPPAPVQTAAPAPSPTTVASAPALEAPPPAPSPAEASSPLDGLAVATAPAAPTARTPARAPAAKPEPVKPSTAPAAAKPKAHARDADAELVAALMSHSDGGAVKALSAQPPLNATERNRFAGVLRDCRYAGNASAQAQCRADACTAFRYWGRTKSCTPAAEASAPPNAKH